MAAMSTPKSSKACCTRARKPSASSALPKVRPTKNSIDK